jgi:hypothetical protein
MKTKASVFILGFVIVTAFSCKARSTDPEDQPTSFTHLSSKCITHGLAKGTGLDSLFTYSFTDKLLIDFSVFSNCCPDSNRFAVTYAIAADTIVIAVADTAQNLCRCICTYMIHAEFAGLQRDHYVVRCKIGNDQGYDDPIHLVQVFRHTRP